MKNKQSIKKRKHRYSLKEAFRYIRQMQGEQVKEQRGLLEKAFYSINARTGFADWEFNKTQNGDYGWFYDYLTT